MIWHPYTIQKGQPNPLKIVRASGEFLYDEKGNPYIDAVSSWWISIHGHNHPYIIEKVKESLSNLDHVLLAGIPSSPRHLTPENSCIVKILFRDKSFFSPNI